MPRQTTYHLDAEWNRSAHTGEYSRHDTQAEAEAELARLLATDPPARWCLYRRTTTETPIASDGEGWDDGAG